MSNDLTHASFFSGVGGLDLGFERAGWRTVSFSEIDPYASAVLARHWPGVPSLGDIQRLASDHLGEGESWEAVSVGSRCPRHPAPGVQAGPGAADGTRPGVDIARAVTGTSGKRHDDDTDTLVPTLRVGGRSQGAGSSYDNTPVIVGPSPDAGRDGATDGLAGRAHHRSRLADSGIAQALDAKRGGPDDNEAQAGHLVVGTLRQHVRPGSNSDHSVVGEYGTANDPLLPLGLDSHRYRCCGNGVVSDVAEWIGHRLRGALEGSHVQ